MQKSNFEKLAARRGRSLEQFTKEFHLIHGQDKTPPEYDSTIIKGWHLYTNVKIVPEFWTPHDDQSAIRCLRFINAYVQISHMVARQFGARILEVQGKRIHFFLENDTKEVSEIISLADALVNVLYVDLNEFDSEVFRGVAAASDYGPAVGVHAFGSDSIITLGPAACAPAKQLNSTSGGCLKYRSTQNGKWIEVDLVDSSRGGTYSTTQRNIINQLQDKIEKVTSECRALEYEVLTDVSKRIYANEGEFNPFGQATLVQGFFVRADLDGFTAQIANAFDLSNPDETIADLLSCFRQTTNDVDFLLQNFDRNKVVQLNWAGDCANFVVLPEADESFGDARRYLPSVIGAQWHDELSDDNRKWVLGIAGDNDTNGISTDGAVLLATIQIGNLSFKISAGWSVGNSLKAQEAEGTNAGDTVLHQKDYKHLNKTYCENFSRLSGTEFYRAHILSMKTLQAASAASATYVSTSGFTPKPYALNGM